MNNVNLALILLAGGIGNRLNKKISKQMIKYNNLTILEMNVKNFIKDLKDIPIQIVTNIDDFAEVFRDYIARNGEQTIWELNFSNNQLDDDAIIKLFDTLIGFAAGVRILKLFRNRIGARGMDSIAQFFGLCPMAVSEIHLSHNQINSEAALALLTGVASNAIYPSEVTGPIWCRLENNPIGNHQEVLNKFEEFLEEARPDLKGVQGGGRVYNLSDHKLRKGDREAKGCIFNLPHFKHNSTIF